MISKELLEAVTGEICTDLTNVLNDNVLDIIHEGIIIDSINIHEFAHKCKEWALALKYRVLTEPYNDYGYTDWMVEVTEYTCPTVRFQLYRSEPEAVFAACQWILDNNVAETSSDDRAS